MVERMRVRVWRKRESNCGIRKGLYEGAVDLVN